MAAGEPKLGKPGAGLPFFEHVLLRYWAFPRFLKRSTWDQRLRLFGKEGERVLELARRDGIDRQKRVLIARVSGMEDSSRFWSVDMTLEHLVIVGAMMQQVIVELNSGHRPTITASTAEVKPTGAAGDDRVVAFETFLRGFKKELTDPTLAGGERSRHPHPWLGPLTAPEWLAIAALHQRVHRQQIEKIVAG